MINSSGSCCTLSDLLKRDFPVKKTMSVYSSYQVPDTDLPLYLEGVDDLDAHAFDHLGTGFSGEIPHDPYLESYGVGTHTAVSTTDENTRLYDLDSQHIVPGARNDMDGSHVAVRADINTDADTQANSVDQLGIGIYTIQLTVLPTSNGSKTSTSSSISIPSKPQTFPLIPIPSKPQTSFPSPISSKPQSSPPIHTPYTDQAWLSETVLSHGYQSLLGDVHVASDNATAWATPATTESATPATPGSHIGQICDTASPTMADRIPDVPRSSLTAGFLPQESLFSGEETWEMSEFQLLSGTQLHHREPESGLSTNGTQSYQKKKKSFMLSTVVI